MTAPDDYRALLHEEISGIDPVGSNRPDIGIVGTLAAPRLSPRFGEILARESLPYGAIQCYQDVDALIGDGRWSVAIVLSPYKQQVVPRCAATTRVVRQLGVADTLVRDVQGHVWGINTNALAIKMALGRAPAFHSVLVVGTGATARCAIAAARAIDPSCEIRVIGRSEARAERIAQELAVETASDERSFTPDVVVNCTTVGEKDDSGDTSLFERWYAWSRTYFDLNTRTSRLQTSALEHGCLVMSGAVMQHAVDNCRMELLRIVTQGHDADR